MNQRKAIVSSAASPASGQRCGYCKQPALNRQTTTTGHTYWLCDDCAKASVLTRSRHTARIEQTPLDEGVKFVYRKDGDTLHVGYDPAKIGALDVRLALGMVADYTEGEKVDKLRELGRNAEDNFVREIFTILLDQIDVHGDVTAVLTCAEKLFRQVMTEAGE
ncbi:hypothetical protein [Streptomyces sp. NPDC085460]|uniref:hypothetical protein n=1 Tax=unclassified Streptomyces TaxID=2593676 RepID=UPI0037D0EDAB